MLGVSPRAPPTSVSLERLTELSIQSVILIATIYYSESTLSKISKGKGAWEVQRKLGKLSRILLQWNHKGTYTSFLQQ